MAGNSLGKNFVVTCFGESHGRCIGTIIDGCPPGLELLESDVQRELDKRKSGKDVISTPRLEEDKVEFLSGVFKGRTTGAPIAMLVWNKNVRSEIYEELRWKPRPGHADYPALFRYKGYNDYRGGGRFSGRITVALVMAGAVAKKLLSEFGAEVLAYTTAIGGILAKPCPTHEEIKTNVYATPVRCADLEAAKLMEKAILKARNEGDSLGGIVECVVLDIPVGVGDPVFNSLDSEIAQALFDVPAVKGVEFGVGFGSACLKGSENNDSYAMKGKNVITLTNNSGGILGGLSNGMPIVVRAAFKPPSSISKRQRTVNLKKMIDTTIQVKGKHDACIVPRAVPVVESAVSIILVDHLLRLGLIKLGDD